MKNYKLNPGVNVAYIPGLGQLREGVIVSGELGKFVPAVLVEVPSMPVMASTPSPRHSAPLESTEPVRAPVVLTEPSPAPSTTVETSQKPEKELLTEGDRPTKRPGKASPK